MAWFGASLDTSMLQVGILISDIIRLQGTAMHNIILHMHLPKTGGTTLSRVLDREFGRLHYDLSFFNLKVPDETGATHVLWRHVGYKYAFSDLMPNWNFKEKDLFDVMRRCSKDVVAISRHGMVIGPSTIDAMMKGKKTGYACRIFPLFFLRKFFPWHVSLYFQQRRDPEHMVHLSSDPEVMVAKTGSFREYTQYCIDSKDSHKRHKCTLNWTARDIDKMLAHIELYQFGLVERYDESLVVIEDMLGEYFLGLDLSYGSPLNVGRLKSGNTLAHNIGEVERQLGKDLAERLSNMGAQSENLYARIEEELNSRILHISNFHSKLDAFRMRCKARQK